MNLVRAIEIAVDAHRLHTDKGGNPYILHPLRVMMSLETIEEKIVGVLHDVVEDTKWTFEDLVKEGFSPEVIEALRSVTKDDSEKNSDEGYFRFVSRAAQNSIGRKVKIADLRDNLDVTRIAHLDAETFARLQKYRKSLALLQETSDQGGQ